MEHNKKTKSKKKVRREVGEDGGGFSFRVFERTHKAGRSYISTQENNNKEKQNERIFFQKKLNNINKHEQT